ncbi:Homeobox domain [Geosmithia morbida]|uniref:Homeobox domain n=1 Tax=Geosmithia morbida TaxID=1094350 RepID=A0A9P5D6V5_9HYPO|nr:Homeobox domain [Geosmithia morbida]KAF4123904.1 Homeobox domain [Geosmithia morbida]
MDAYSQGWAGMPFSEVDDAFATYPQYPATNYNAILASSMEAYQAQHHHLVHHQPMSRTTESKPRLSKDEVDTLEKEFQKNHKPNSSTKKSLAEAMRVENARINNWFQNRRAREKKERNIREYEAKQKLEREQKGSSHPGGSSNLPTRGSHLVASSAPFPNAPHSSSSPSAAASPEQSPILDHESDAAGSDDAAETHAATDIFRLPDQLFSFDMPAATQMSYEYSGTSPSNGTSEVNEPVITTDDDDDADYFVNTHNNPSMQQFQQLFSHSMPKRNNALASPPAIDINSRRSRSRPAPLSIGGSSRSYSLGVPRTASIDNMSYRRGSDMMCRRVMSSSRINKLNSVPRSPFPVNWSPAFGRKSSNSSSDTAPPTPETPMADHSNMASNNGADNLLMPSSDLHTPPTTPGIRRNLYNSNSNLNSFYDMSMPTTDASVVASSMVSFPGSTSNSSLSMMTPNYLANSMSQPQTPSFASPMGTSPLTGPEYTWAAGGIMSESFSPEDQHQSAGPHYYSMSIPTFGMET